MTETPSDDEQPTEADAEETPADTPAEEAPAEPAAEEAPAEEAPAEEPVAEEAPAEEAPAETAAAEEPAAGEAPAEDAAAEEPAAASADDEGAPTDAVAEVPAEEPSTARDRSASPPKEKKAKDVVPGADLEPIAISEERELTAEERARIEAEEEERAAREAAATAEDEEEAVAPRTITIAPDARVQATGKRKSAVARVIVGAGDGSFEINGRPLEQYFPSTQHQSLARQPLVASGYDGSVDVRVRVHGGGVSGQAGAVRHGIARALTDLEPELRPELKRRGMLTRDDRRKERKKAGLKKARKRPQFSKR